MVKLSKQMIGTKPTRTERVGEQRRKEIYDEQVYREEQKFNKLKAEAETIREEQFKDQIVDGKTIPFKLENGEHSYREIYQKLSPDLKQFFETPDIVIQQKTTRIADTKSQIQEKQIYADQQIQKERDRFAESKAYYDRQRQKLRSQGLSSSRYKSKKDKLRADLHDDSDEMEEKIQYWGGYKRGLNKGSTELSAGKEVDYKSIIDYADELGDYEESKKEARNEKRAFDKSKIDRIKQLEEAGYKPFVIEQSYKGMPEKAMLKYYNVKTGDWQSIADFPIKTKVDVSGLTRLGFTTPETKALQYLGKEYRFKTGTGFYKNVKGDVVTPYGKTGFTEDQLIKQSYDVAYTKWQKKQPPITKVPIVKQAKVSDVVDDRKWYDKSMEELFISSARKKVKYHSAIAWRGLTDFTSFVESNAMKVYAKIPAPQSLAYAPKMKTLEESEKKREVLEKVKGEEIGLKNIQKEYEDIKQIAFEQAHMKSLIYKEKTFEQASAEFEQSAKAKKIKKDYEAIVKKELIKVGVTKTDFKIAGLKMLETAVSLVPTTAKGVVVTAGGLKIGQTIYKTIPSFIKASAYRGLGIHAGLKLASPSSLPSQKVGAIFTLGTLGLSQAYTGVKWYRSPVSIRSSIPAPKMSMKAVDVIGEDYGSKVLFNTQKLSQQARAGSKTIIKTKGSLFLEKYTKIKLPSLYEGVPTAQAKYSIEGFRALFKYSTPSKYQKGYKRLIADKSTPSSAKATLRYTAPQVQELILEKGAIIIKGKKGLARFDHLIKKPIIKVDGIKTRGGRTIKEISFEDRVLKKDYVRMDRTKTSLILEKGKVVDFKNIKYGKGISIGKGTDLKKGYGYVGKDKLGMEVFEDVIYKDIHGIAVSKTILPSSKAIHLDTSNTKLISRIIDKQTKQFGFKRTGIKKTPFSKTFGSKPIDEIKDIIKGKPTLTMGKLVPEQTQMNVQQLKSAFTPDIKKLTKVKDLVKAKQLDKITGVKMSSVLGTKILSELKTKSKTDVKLKTDLKSMIKLKDILKEDTALKLKQSQALKMSPALKTDLKLKSAVQNLIGVSLTAPIIRVSKVPKTTSAIIGLPLWLKGEVSKKLKKQKKGKFEEFAYLPDFTTRAIGLSPDVITGKQAQAKIKKILSGMEIRRGIMIK